MGRYTNPASSLLKKSDDKQINSFEMKEFKTVSLLRVSWTEKEVKRLGTLESRN